MLNVKNQYLSNRTIFHSAVNMKTMHFKVQIKMPHATMLKQANISCSDLTPTHSRLTTFTSKLDFLRLSPPHINDATKA